MCLHHIYPLNIKKYLTSTDRQDLAKLATFFKVNNICPNRQNLPYSQIVFARSTKFFIFHLFPSPPHMRLCYLVRILLKMHEKTITTCKDLNSFAARVFHPI